MSDCYIQDRECDSDEFQECERHFKCVCETHQKKLEPNRTMIKCGNSGSLVLPVNTRSDTRFTLTTVNVNIKDFKKPCIKLEFTSDIATTEAALILEFHIFKSCKTITFPIGPIWTFSRPLAITDSDTFSFFVCDCDFCDDECCTYSVVIRVASTVTVGVTTINHASLSALIVDNDCNVCK